MYDFFWKVTDIEYKKFIKDKQKRYKNNLEKARKNLL